MDITLYCTMYCILYVRLSHSLLKATWLDLQLQRLSFEISNMTASCHLGFGATGSKATRSTVRKNCSVSALNDFCCCHWSLCLDPHNGDQPSLDITNSLTVICVSCKRSLLWIQFFVVAEFFAYLLVRQQKLKKGTVCNWFLQVTTGMWQQFIVYAVKMLSHLSQGNVAMLSRWAGSIYYHTQHISM